MSRSPSSTTVDSDRLLHPTPGGGGKCPVDHETRSLWKLFGGSSSSGDNNGKERGGVASAASGARVVPVVASLEEAAKYAQTPQPGQKLPLSTHRMESTIPRSNSSTSSPDRARPLPAHQIRVTSNTTTSSNDDNNNNNKNSTWIYPSEQQVYNAMQRKGWNTIEEEAIPSFLQIHNSVNERGWKQIQQWEQPLPQPQHSHTATINTNTNISTSTSTTTELELSRFEGRPKELSPKAWFLSTFGFRKPPFDRHDWYIVQKTTTTPNVNDRTTNPPLGDNHNNNEVVVVSEEKRYILDFYMTEEGTNNNNRTMSMMPRVDIDVRPALDTPDAIRQRGTQFLRELFPGIAREYAERRPGLAWRYPET